MKIWIDGSGWNGKVSRWMVACEDGRTKGDCFDYERTNNEMEYGALLDALNSFAQGEDVIYSDSQLVVNQVSGKWRVKEPRLFSLCQSAKMHMDRIGCTLVWIPREQNKAGHMLER